MNILRHILLITLLTGPVAAADLDFQKIFQTPEFKARFAASYGFNSSVEPTITQEEKQLLDEVAHGLDVLLEGLLGVLLHLELFLVFSETLHFLHGEHVGTYLFDQFAA